MANQDWTKIAKKRFENIPRNSSETAYYGVYNSILSKVFPAEYYEVCPQPYSLNDSNVIKYLVEDEKGFPVLAVSIRKEISPNNVVDNNKMYSEIRAKLLDLLPLIKNPQFYLISAFGRYCYVYCLDKDTAKIHPEPNNLQNPSPIDLCTDEGQQGLITIFNNVHRMCESV